MKIAVEFTLEELQAIEEQYHDLVKDFPDDKLYQSIEHKATSALVELEKVKRLQNLMKHATKNKS